MSAGIKTKLISRKHVKLWALAVAEKRSHKFTRVGGAFYIRCESNLKEFFRLHVQQIPSKGKTIN